MKILYHHRIASKDGQYVHIEEIVNALRQAGHEVVMVEPGSINAKQFGQSSSLVSNIRKYVPNFLHELIEFSYAIWDFARLMSALIKHKPDVIYERYNLFFPSGVWVKKLSGLPFILEVNSPLLEERSRHDHISLKGLADWSERYCWNNADYALPVTEVLSHSLTAKGVNRQQIRVIHNGINKQSFFEGIDSSAIRQRYQLDGKLVLGFVGFVREWHRLDRVVDVLKKHQDKPWCLFVAGDGPALRDIEAKARELGVSDKIILAGVVGRQDIPNYMECFDVALQPDVVDYASPLKLFEYLALGKAVLAPDKANIREVLTDGENSLFFDVDSDQDFVAKLEQLCESEQLRQLLGQQARQLIDDRQYYWSGNAAKIVELFNGLLQKRCKPAADSHV